METIFFMLLETSSKRHADMPVIKYFADKKSLLDFYEWIKLNHKMYEQKIGYKCSIKNIKFIKNGY